MNSSTNNGGKSVPNFALTPNRNLAFLGSPPLVPGEDASAYERLLTIVTNTVKPIDCVEVILIRDFVDEEWEILRYRRATANLIKAAKAEALADALRQATSQDFSFDDQAPEKLALGWTKGDQDAIEKVQTLLDPAELTEDAIIARAVSLKLNDVERLDRMVMTKEARRNNALEETERHRANFGARLRRAAEQVEDADFCVIEESPAGEKRAP
jgi:hypothetical protein